MSIFHWSLLYILALVLTFGLSRFLPKDSRAQKLAKHAVTTLTAGLLEAAKWAVGKIRTEK